MSHDGRNRNFVQPVSDGSPRKGSSVLGYPTAVSSPLHWSWTDRSEFVDQTYQDLVELLEQLEVQQPTDVVIQAEAGLDRALKIARLVIQQRASVRIHIVAHRVSVQHVALARSAGVSSIHEADAGYDGLIRSLHDPAWRQSFGRQPQSTIGTLAIDFARRKVSVRDTPLSVTKTEFEILRTLTIEPGVLVERQRLIESVWGPGWFGASNVLDTHLTNLRAKLLSAGHQGAIVTVHGSGFYFEPQTWEMADGFASEMVG
jgi:DNA-binding response OmpR family regulator